MIKLNRKSQSSAHQEVRKKVSIGSTSLDRTNNKQAKDSFRSESSSGAAPNIGNLPITIDLDPVLYGIAEDNGQGNRKTFNKLYHDMYNYDAVCGATVDLYSTLPFSDFTLGGVSNSSVLEIFYENIERLNIRTLLNELSIDYMVTGTFLGSLLYNKEKKLFFDIMPHDVGNADIMSLPFYSQDPIIKVTFPDTVTRALKSGSKRTQAICEKLGPAVVEKLLSGSLELDPLGTIYLPRKTFSSSEGTSMFKRVLPIYLIEKNLYRGTLIESAKRQRGILHITAGDGDQWDPTPGDLESITDLFINADSDPLGAIITTRIGISTEEVRCLTGDTFIHTKFGLKRLDSLVAHNPDTLPVDTTYILPIVAKGHNGKYVTLQQWHYRGKKQTFEYFTESGTRIRSTCNHKFLVLTEKFTLEYKKALDLCESDYLCSLAVNIDTYNDAELEHYSFVQNDYPTVLTANFAKLIAAIQVYGSLSDNVLTLDCLCVEYARRVSTLFDSIFYTIDHSDSQILRVKDLSLFSFFESIGLFGFGSGSDYSTYKLNTFIPSCVIQSNTDCKFAYVASFLECSLFSTFDRCDTVASFKNFDDAHLFKVFLNDLGYFSVLSTKVDVDSLFKLTIVDYPDLHYKLMCHYNDVYDTVNTRKFTNVGVPLCLLLKVLSERRVGEKKYLSDDGSIITTRTDFDSFRECKDSVLGYDTITQYSIEFNALSEISASMAVAINLILHNQYHFEKIVEIADYGIQHVYDLSVDTTDEAEQAFLANGIVTHNSPADFWKWTDITDQTTPMKLKAFGIGEDFLSGSQSINCVIGSTLIPTSSGLQKIGEMCNESYGNLQSPINVKVGSRYNPEYVTKWLYSGKQDTIRITAESGNFITGTAKHRVLVWRNGIEDYVYLSDVRLSDYVMLSPTPVYKDTSYIVRKTNIVVDADFAYMLGCITRRGYTVKNTLNILLYKDIGSKFIQICETLFGKVTVYERESKYSIVIDNPETVALLNSLVSKEEIPNCILRTSRDAQLAFVASFIDNSTMTKIQLDTNVFSRDFLVLLNSFGIFANCKNNTITLPLGEEYHLHKLVGDYLCKKYTTTYRIREWYGVPTTDGKIIPYDVSDNVENVVKYRYVKVVNITDAGSQKVYDLSINPNNPSYVANGIVSHNTMDANMTVFIEQLRAYRDRICRKLLYDKVFPLISMVNGISISRSGKITKTGNPIDNIENALDILQDGSRLLIPVVHWNKQLKPEGDTAYLDILDRMTAAGIPPPLRALAAAGGFNLDEILNQADDDISIRERMAVYAKRLEKFKAKSAEGGEGDFEATASALRLLDESPDRKHFSSVLANVGKKNLLNRKFDPEIVGRTKTGKKKVIHNQIKANRDFNNTLVKSVKEIAKKDDTILTRKSTTRKE